MAASSALRVRRPARGLARRLQAARDDERAHLARELHDELGALLTAARLDAARLRTGLAPAAADAPQRLAQLEASLEGLVALKGRLVEGLQPVALARAGLVPALQGAALDFARRSGVAVHCDLAPVRLAAGGRLAVYRLVQEALNNVAKHAAARQVWLRLGEQGGRVEAWVRDDGRGFDPHGVGPAAYGLAGLRRRAEAERGSLVLRSAPGQGTRIGLRLPRGG